MAFPKGYGFYGSCAFCPRNKDCDQGKHCKIFTNLKPAGSRKKPKIVLRTDKENYTAGDLLLRGIVWTMRFAVGALIAYFIYDRTK
jgi:hypothetical protein